MQLENQKYRTKFLMGGLPETTNSLRRAGHWAVLHKHAQTWKKNVSMCVFSNKPKKPLEKAQLILTRKSSVAPDPDGLVSSFKHIIDGLVACGVLADDKYSNIGMPTYLWEKAPKGEGSVEVEVIEV